MTLKLTPQIKTDLLKDLLNEKGKINLHYTGSSMNPFLKEGDLMTAEKATSQNIKVGKIALFEEEEKLIVHRIFLIRTKEGRTWVYTGGDAHLRMDRRRPIEQILGMLTQPKESKIKAYCKARFLLFCSVGHYVKIKIQKGILKS